MGRNAPEIFADIVVGAGASIFNGAKALWDGEIVADTFELADVLINQTSAGLVNTAFVLRDIVERNAGEIVADIVRGAGLGFFDAGFALWEIGGVISNSRDLISVLNSEGAGFDTLVNVLVDIVEFSHVDATAIVNDFLGIGDGGNLIPGVDVPFVPFI